MSILLDKETRLLVQGITGREGTFHTTRMIEYGTNVVAGVTPGKGGQVVLDRPVFNTVEEACRETGANASVIFVPAFAAADAIMESAASDLDLVVCIAEGIPVQDMMKVRRFIADRKTRLVGANCPGVISPGKAKAGIMSGAIHTPGPVGVVSRSGTLTYEIVYHLTRVGIGQSTCVGIGGDQVVGQNFLDILELFEADDETKGVALIGEIGGEDEQRAARYISSKMSKPVVAFVAGQTAPPGKRMGHAGAIIAGTEGTAAEKISTFEENNVKVAAYPAEVAEIMKSIFTGSSVDA